MATPSRRGRQRVPGNSGTATKRSSEESSKLPNGSARMAARKAAATPELPPDDLAARLPTDMLPALAEWRSQHLKQLDAAVKLLGSKSRDDVETALIEIQTEYNQSISSFQPTKLEKKAARKMLKLLQRILQLMKVNRMPAGIELFYYDPTKQAIEACEKVVAAPPADNPRKGAKLKRLVVREAAALMGKHWLAGSAVDGRKILVKLATVLYGDPSVNLTSQCAAYVREARKAK